MPVRGVTRAWAFIFMEIKMVADEWITAGAIVLTVLSAGLLYLVSKQQVWLSEPLPLPVGLLGAAIALCMAVLVWHKVIGLVPAICGVMVCLMLSATLLPYFSVFVQKRWRHGL